MKDEERRLGKKGCVSEVVRPCGGRAGLSAAGLATEIAAARRHLPEPVLVRLAADAPSTPALVAMAAVMGRGDGGGQVSSSTPAAASCEGVKGEGGSGEGDVVRRQRSSDSLTLSSELSSASEQGVFVCRKYDTYHVCRMCVLVGTGCWGSWMSIRGSVEVRIGYEGVSWGVKLGL